MLNATTPTGVVGLILGGVLSLLYGVRLITGAMQCNASIQLRRSLTVLTRYPLVAFGVGMGLTLVTQSSGATSSLLVSLVSDDLLTLPIAIIALLGTNIGSALMVQLLIFHITAYAIVIVGLGAAIALFTYQSQKRDIGQACFGFGLIILGLAALEAGSFPLGGSPATILVLDALLHSPVVLALIGMILTMIFASSIAGIGLIMVLASAGSLPLEAALALMVGANVGSTVTALLTALTRGSVAGRRLAFFHTGTKLVIALVVLSALDPLSSVIAIVPLPAGTLVALSHLMFNLLLTLLFLPLAQPLARLVERLLPALTEQSAPRVRYLHPDAPSDPAIALGRAMREVLHMTDLLTDMLHLGIDAFGDSPTTVPARIGELDDQLDEINASIKSYLTQLDNQQMSEGQERRLFALLYLITDLEEMGDLVDKQWMRLARRKHRKRMIFSAEGWQDLVAFHQEVLNATQQAFAALAAQDRHLAAEFFTSKARLSHLSQELHVRHVQRLRSGVLPSIESSAIHLDFLNAMRRVLSHSATIAHMVQENLSLNLSETS